MAADSGERVDRSGIFGQVPRWLNATLLIAAIPLIPGAILACDFFYELGYAQYFGIPYDFISPQFSSATYPTVLVVISTAFTVAVLDTYLGHRSPGPMRDWERLVAKFGWVLPLLVGILVAARAWKALLFLPALAVGSVIGWRLGGWLQRVIHRYLRWLVRRLDPKRHPLTSTFIALGWAGSIAAFLCATAFAWGFVVASGQAAYQVSVDHPDQLLVRQYGDTAIFADVDRKRLKLTGTLHEVKVGDKSINVKVETLGQVQPPGP